MDERQAAQDDEVSLLSILVVLAESWMLLLIVPILAGLAAFGLSQMQTRSFSSSAELSMPQIEVEAALTDDFVAAAVDSHVPEQAVAEVLDGLSVDFLTGSPSDTAVTLQLTDRDMVQPVLTAITTELDQTAGRAFLTGLSSEIEERAGELDALRATLERTITRLEAQLQSPDEQENFNAESFSQTAGALAPLIAQSRELTNSSRLLRQELDLLPSTIVKVPASPPRVLTTRLAPLPVAIVATFFTGFVLLLFVLIRSGLRSAAATPEGAAKVERIRQAFRLKRASSGSGNA